MNTYFNLIQGDRVELKYDFDRGRLQAGHRGTVQRVSDWLGKTNVKVSVLFDGDNAAYEFNPQTGGVLRRLISLSDPLENFVEELLDIARENPIDDARIIIRDRLLKDTQRAIDLDFDPFRRAFNKAAQVVQPTIDEESKGDDTGEIMGLRFNTPAKGAK